MNDSDRANAFILARAGYDVWMGNNRGSVMSLGHKTLSPDDKDYWDYYQLEMGMKDVPSFIDFILAKTGLETLSYIGHSQGTTQMFLAASMNPDYFAEKINVFVALAPVASTQYLKVKSLRAAANHIHLCTFLLTDVLSYYSWFAPMYLGSEAIDAFCLIEKDLCRNFMSHLLNPALDNVDRFEMGVSDLPAG